MRVLVTRGAADGQALAAELTARGYDVLHEPLIEIETLPVASDELSAALDGVQALLFTSANGARALAAKIAQRHWPVFAVGDATAAAALEVGFGKVASAGGDVTDLAVLVRERLRPDAGALFHPAASKLAGDLKGELEAAGFEVRRRTLYEARPASAFSAATRQALADGEIDAVLIFSPRTGTTFVSLTRTAGLGGACSGVQAVCLSQAVADTLAALSWAGLHVAARPTSVALVASLDAIKRGTEGAVRLDKPRPGSLLQDDDPARTSGSTTRTAEAMAEGTGSGGGSNKDQGAANPTPANPTPADSTAADGAEAPALRVIAAFGGIRPMAGKLEVAVSTVQGWRERAAIPAGRHDEILAAAKKHNVTLDPMVLKDADHPPAESATKAAATAPKSESKSAASASPSSAAASSSAPQGSGSGGSGSQGSGTAGKSAIPTVRSAGAPAVTAATKTAPSGSTPSSGQKAASSAPAQAAGSKGTGTSAPTAAAKPASSSSATSSSASAATSAPASKTPGAAASKASSPPPPAARRGSMVPGFILGVIVAVAVFLGTVFTREHWEPVVAGLLPGGGATGGPSAEEAAAALDAELEARVMAALDSATAEQAARIASLEEAPQGGEPVDLSGVSGRIDDLEQRLSEVPSGDSGLETAFAALSARVDAVEQGGGDSAASDAALADLGARIDAVEQGSGDAAATDAALAALQADRDALSAETKALNDTLAGLRQELADLAAANQALETTVAAQAAASGATKLDQNVALVLALGQLRDALRGSGAFAAELAQVQSLMGESDELQGAIAPLAQHAESGLPTLTALQRSFPATARSVVAAGQGGDDDGLLAGVMRSVSSIVTVRPVGEVEGGGAGPTVARAEARLQDGDLAGALGALDELTGRAADAAAGWRAEAEARLAADRAVAALASRSIGQIAPAGG